MKAALIILVALLAGCVLPPTMENAPGYYLNPATGKWTPVEQPADISVQIIWGWDSEINYNSGDLCWLGWDPTEEVLIDWISLRDENIGHRPVMYGVEPVSPEWWARWRRELP